MFLLRWQGEEDTDGLSDDGSGAAGSEVILISIYVVSYIYICSNNDIGIDTILEPI